MRKDRTLWESNEKEIEELARLKAKYESQQDDLQ